MENKTTPLVPAEVMMLKPILIQLAQLKGKIEHATQLRNELTGKKWKLDENKMHWEEVE